MTENQAGSTETETSHLLPKTNGPEQDGQLSGIVERPTGQSASADENDNDGAVVVKEPTTLELSLIMGAMYTGVFFAALGSSPELDHAE